MKALCMGLVLLAALMISGVFSTATATPPAQPLVASAEPFFVPLTQDLSPLIDLLN